MYKQILSLVLFAAKGKGKGKREAKKGKPHSAAKRKEVENVILDDEAIRDLFDFPFIEDYISTIEGEDLIKDDIREIIDAEMNVLGIETGVAKDEVILEEMKKTYSDIEDLLMRSIDVSEAKDSEMEAIYVPQEGAIGLPVTPGKGIERSPGVIELQVTPAKIQSVEGEKKIIELPTTPIPGVEELPREEVIELPIKPMKTHFLDPPHLSHPPRAIATPKSGPKKENSYGISKMMKTHFFEPTPPLPPQKAPKKRGTNNIPGWQKKGAGLFFQDDEKGIIELPEKEIPVERPAEHFRKVPAYEKEKTVTERGLRPEQHVIAEMMAKRGLLRKPSTGLKKPEKKTVSEEELTRLQELQKKQREAIKRRLEEKKVRNVGWSELVDVKEKRLGRLKALKKKRSKRRTRYRKEKLQKLQEKEKLEIEKEKQIEPRVPARKERKEFSTRESLRTFAAVDKEYYPEPEEDELDFKEMAVPPKESMSAAPVVPGVTFAAIKTCPSCGSFINLSVSNKCYSCGVTYK